MAIKITHIIDFSPAVLALIAAGQGIAFDKPKAAVADKPKAAADDKPAKEETKKAAPAKGKGKAADSEEFPETLEGARAAIRSLASTDGNNGESGGIEFAQKMMADEFGVKGVPQLDEGKYGEFIERCKELVSTGGFKVHGKTEAKKQSAADVF